LSRLGLPAAPETGFFVPHAGFVVGLADEDVRALAAAGGYRVAAFEFKNDGFALLLPPAHG
jgi:hypothetical protein